MMTRNLTLALSLRSLGYAVAFEGAKPGWKLDADGKIEMRDGNPIYVDSAGQELTLGTDTISRLNGEAKTQRERAEAAEGKLTKWKDLEAAGVDPAKALEALNTVKDIKDGDLIKAGEVQKIRDEIGKNYETKINELTTKNGELTGQIDSMTLGGAFTGSKWISDNIAIPVDLLQAQFGKQFKRENGNLVAYDANGNKIYSKQRGGELASFDEAMSIIVEGYAHKDSILKGGNNTGTGSNGNGGANGNQQRIVRRADFDKLPPNQQADTAAKARAGEVSIVD